MIINNLAVEYRDEGSGPTMLFLHGWQDNLHTFDALVDVLKDKWRIVRVDLPGSGASEMPKSAWNLDRYVQFVTDFIAKLGVSPEIIVGHSFGGRILIKAIAIKAIHPQKAVLIGSAGITKTHTPRNIFFKICAKLGKIIILIPPFFFWRDSIRKKLYTAAGSDYLQAGALRDTFLNIIKEDLSSAAAEIDIPILLIWGSDDTETPVSDGKQLAAIIPGSRFKIIPNAGHFVHQEYPEHVSELIQDFLL
ncbi:MAG: alpha/beta hydrolase [Candidatus Sungbacteria bacterium]|nr:alpha/beta hydrolase [Candidatus Sungbacteria bacterium]